MDTLFQAVVWSLLIFLALKVLVGTRTGRIILLPVGVVSHFLKFLAFSILGRTKELFRMVSEGVEFSDTFFFEAQGSTQEVSVARVMEIVRNYNKEHEWFCEPMTVFTHHDKLAGFTRLFRPLTALTLGSDRRIYGDIEKILECLREVSEHCGVSWVIHNTIGVEGKITAGEFDSRLMETIGLWRKNTFWFG